MRIIKPGVEGPKELPHCVFRDDMTKAIGDEVWPVLQAQGWVEYAPAATELLAEVESEEKARAEAEIAALWQAAHDYEYSFINGSAIGLLTAGLVRGLPKAQAVAAWTGSIWRLYFQRKEAILAGGKAELDFTGCGPLPYPVRELMEEGGF